MHLKAKQFLQQGGVEMFTGLLFYAYVGIHQERILVLDNYYQRCPVPLTCDYCFVIIAFYSTWNLYEDGTLLKEDTATQ